MSFNKLTPAEAERLAFLAEECGEVVQAVGKVLRHGYNERSPFNDRVLEDNRYDLEKEVGHVLAVVELMLGSSDLDATKVALHQVKKLRSILDDTYMHEQHNADDKEKSDEGVYNGA